MNTPWKTTLADKQGLADNNVFVNPADLLNLKTPSICPLLHLSCLSISGKDAAKLLQGQLACNVNEVTENLSNFTAMCNPKGRVIATFLLVKWVNAYLIILPDDLLETVQRKLQLYVLRSDVKITDSTDALCLLGTSDPAQTCSAFVTENHHDILFVSLPGKLGRKLIIAETEKGLGFWAEQCGSESVKIGEDVNKGENVNKASADAWRYLDIISGLPWLSQATSEEFIPQMLNLDKLGGVSFNKGCYTGQEIVARTHYLGKAKRELFLGEAKVAIAPSASSNIVRLSGAEQEVMGKVLQSQMTQDGFIMQFVLHRGEADHGDMGSLNLALDDETKTPVKIIPFPT